MAGYTRQSIADIINGLEVTAPPLNAEFNQMAAAFVGATGHSHDGTDGNAPKIDLTTSVDGFLPAVHGGVGGQNKTDATANPIVTNDNTQGYAPGSLWLNNNTGRVFICVGNNTGAAVWREVAVITENDVFFPETNDTVDLGTAANRFKALYLSGNIDAQGNLTLGGAATIAGNASVGGNLSVTGTSTLATVDINAGNIDGTTVGGSSPAQGTFTNLTANTLLTAASVDINGGNIDGTTIGNVTPAAGSFSTVDIDGGTIDGATIGATNPATATFTAVGINGGSIDGTALGQTTPATGNFTTLTASSSLTASNVSLDGGSITATFTGDLTGNVTAPTGTTTLNNLTVNGAADFTNTQLQNVSTPTIASHAATKGYVDAEINNLIGGAPTTLDTLNEIAASLNDDANAFNSLDAKIDTKVSKAGDTLTGDLAMSNNIVTGLKAPSVGSDAVNLTYVTTLFGSTDDAATSADLAFRYAEETEDTEVEPGTFSSKHYSLKASASASAASSSETNAASSETATANALDEFTDLYLGSKSSEPLLDNDGDALQDGALYKDTNTGQLRYYSAAESAWKATTPGPAEQANIDTVATNIGDVDTVVANLADVQTVSNDITAVNNVSTNMSSVQDASGSLDQVHTAMLQMATAFTNSQTRYVDAHAFA